jgi:hypothetical protein
MTWFVRDQRLGVQAGQVDEYQLGNPGLKMFICIFGLDPGLNMNYGGGGPLSKLKGNGILRSAILAIRISLFENKPRGHKYGNA